MKLFIAALLFLAFALTAADTPVVVNISVKNPVPVRVQGPSEPFSFSNQIINPAAAVSSSTHDSTCRPASA